MKIHHAIIEQATESDNTEYAWLTCERKERIENPKYTNKWEYVTCKRCLKLRGYQ